MPVASVDVRGVKQSHGGSFANVRRWPETRHRPGQRFGAEDAWISVLPRPEQLRRVPHYRLPSVLEHRERLSDFGNRLFRAFSIEDDNVGRAADGKAIVGNIKQPR